MRVSARSRFSGASVRLGGADDERLVRRESREPKARDGEEQCDDACFGECDAPNDGEGHGESAGGCADEENREGRVDEEAERDDGLETDALRGLGDRHHRQQGDSHLDRE